MPEYDLRVSASFLSPIPSLNYCIHWTVPLFFHFIYINFSSLLTAAPLFLFYSYLSNPCDRYLSDPSYFLVISWTGDPAAILDILFEVFVTDRKSYVPSIPRMERNLRVLWTVPPLLRFYVSLLCLCFWWFYYTRNPNICQYFFQKFFKIFASSFVLN